jgi:hypothetical protein
MRSSADIAKLHAIAAERGTNSHDANAVIAGFSALRFGMMEASVYLGFYAAHPSEQAKAFMLADAICDQFLGSTGRAQR